MKTKLLSGLVAVAVAFSAVGRSTTLYAAPADAVPISQQWAAQPMVAVREHVLALKSDGTVWAFGLNDFGQLGTGDTQNQMYPVQVKGPDGQGFLENVVQVGAGWHCSYALKSDGTVWAWGSNEFGQLGSSAQQNSLYPVQVAGLDGAAALEQVVKIAALPSGETLSAIALLQDGTLVQWGRGAFGSAAVKPLPAPVKQGDAPVQNVQDIASDDRLCYALQDGGVLVWGSEEMPVPQPMKNSEGNPLREIVQIGSGLAKQQDGTLYSYKANAGGSAGNGTTDVTDYATVVMLDDITPFTQADVLADSTRGRRFLLDQEGNAWSWGAGEAAQLGDGASRGVNPWPNQQKALGSPYSLAGGPLNTFIIQADGTLWFVGGYGYLDEATAPEFSEKIAREPVQVMQDKEGTTPFLLFEAPPETGTGNGGAALLWIQLQVGESADLLAMAVSDANPEQAVEWSSDNEAVATVDANGVVTGVAEGFANITAQTQGGSQVSVTGIRVAAPAVPVLRIDLRLKAGSTIMLSATDESRTDLQAIEWTSSDPAIAQVDNTGLVTGVAAGTATIHASRAGTELNTITIQVVEAAVPPVEPPSSSSSAASAIEGSSSTSSESSSGSSSGSSVSSAAGENASSVSSSTSAPAASSSRASSIASSFPSQGMQPAQKIPSTSTGKTGAERQ